MAVHSLQVARAKKILGNRANQAEAAGAAYVEALKQLTDALVNAEESANNAFLAVIGAQRRIEIVAAVGEAMAAADSLRTRVERFGKFPDIKQ